MKSRIHIISYAYHKIYWSYISILLLNEKNSTIVGYATLVSSCFSIIGFLRARSCNPVWLFRFSGLSRPILFGGFLIKLELLLPCNKEYHRPIC